MGRHPHDGLVVNHGEVIRRVDPGGRHHLRCTVVWLSSLLFIPLGLLVGATAYVRLNISPSLPYGLYRIHPVARPLTPRMLVIVHVPGWSAPARPFLKPVAAVGGDWVCRADHALMIAGKDYGPVYDAWRGEPLPSAVAEDRCAMVPPGHVFLASKAPQSVDSRYFGPVAIAHLSALATPLLTWSTADATTDR